MRVDLSASICDPLSQIQGERERQNAPLYTQEFQALTPPAPGRPGGAGEPAVLAPGILACKGAHFAARVPLGFARADRDRKSVV